ncbi:uncharacterized protein LOC128254314 isoform X1 [Drosophila gunungcola]|uniref:uncharacterized protein LOC128254314 isoform X1 n=1 Tax=Drosophila gunungcola TaxID=103775 RepID=UPI0022E208DF|nr:uncharacterized protein LOC128254314 isoform X1 [Drosophila gunungcola]
MPVQPGLFLVLVRIFFLRGTVIAQHNSETYMQNFLGLLAGNTSISDGQLSMVSNYFCPLLMLFIWILSLCFLVCTCVYCKFVKSETFTTYDSNSIEMQDVHILEPTFNHVKGCACLECLHRQLTKEFEKKNGM